VRISQIGDEREAVIAEYEARLAKDPQNPVLLYLAARAEYSQKTPQAIANLKQAIKIAPSFGLPFLLLAQIYSAPAFADPAKVAQSLDHFGELCPTSVRTFSELFWAKDNALMIRTVSRVRGAIKGRTDVEAEIAYPKLWRLEQATHRSDDQAANRALIVNDAEWLRDSRVPRTADWLTALENASDMTDVPKIQDDADAEIVRLFPNSDTGSRLRWRSGKREILGPRGTRRKRSFSHSGSASSKSFFPSPASGRRLKAPLTTRQRPRLPMSPARLSRYAMRSHFFSLPINRTPRTFLQYGHCHCNSRRV